MRIIAAGDRDVVSRRRLGTASLCPKAALAAKHRNIHTNMSFCDSTELVKVAIDIGSSGFRIEGYGVMDRLVFSEKRNMWLMREVER